MGMVYRADDLKLGQPVALKFLPEKLERDDEAVQILTVFRSKGLDEVRLDRVRLIYNGAEPILPEVCREFLDAFVCKLWR